MDNDRTSRGLIFPTPHAAAVDSLVTYATANGENTAEYAAEFMAQSSFEIIAELDKDGWDLPGFESGTIDVGAVIDEAREVIRAMLNN